MSLNLNILAEQNVYARLIVSKIPPRLTGFQKATIDNSKSAKAIYSYYGNDASVPPLTENVDVNAYSITSLPDTLAYLPRNSIYDYLMLITSGDQDYRKLYVTSQHDTYDMTNGPTLAAKVPSLYTKNVTQAIYQTNPLLSGKPLFASDPPDFAVTPVQSQNIATAINIVPDNRFNDITNSNFGEKFGSLHLELKSILDDSNNSSEQKRFTVNDVLTAMGISEDTLAYVKSQPLVENLNKNAETITVYTVLQMLNNDGVTISDDQLNRFVLTLQQSIDSFGQTQESTTPNNTITSPTTSAATV